MLAEKMRDKTVKRIIFFASGSGTNVENIIKYFRGIFWPIPSLLYCYVPTPRCNFVDFNHHNRRSLILNVSLKFGQNH